MNAETFSEDVVKLGKPVVSPAEAVSIARNFLMSFHLEAPRKIFRPKLKARVIDHNAIGSEWLIAVGPYELTISAQSGHVLRFADTPAVDRISKAQMFSHSNPFNGAVRPILTMPPAATLIGKRSVLTLFGKPIFALRPSGNYIELVDALPVLNFVNTVVFEFEPRTGRPVLFSRAIDMSLRRFTRAMKEAEALKFASRISPKQLQTLLDRPETAGSAPMQLGYFVIRPPRAKHARYVGEPEKAVLTWAIRTEDSEIFIDAGNGHLLGGWKLATHG